MEFCFLNDVKFHERKKLYFSRLINANSHKKGKGFGVLLPLFGVVLHLQIIFDLLVSPLALRILGDYF